MKTTIDIPDAVAAEAKSLTAEQGATLRDLVVAGLRAELQRRRNRPVVDFVFPTFGGEGLVVELTPSQVIEASYGLEDR